MTKLSRISFFLFVSGYNYLWLRIIVFKYFYNTYGSMGFFYTMILAAAILLFYLLVPKRLIHHSYEEGLQKSFFKIFYNIVLLLEIILGSSYCIYLLSNIFIPTGNFYIMTIVGVLAIVLVSFYRPKDIMELSTLFFMIGYAILFLTLFFYPNLDYSLLMPFRQTSYWALPIFFIMFLGDNFTLLIHKKDVNFSKLNYVMALLFSLLFFGAEYFILICNAGDKFFINLDWVGFISLSIEPITKYLGNFDFAYIYYILICCIFKYAYNLSIVKESFKLNSKLISSIFFITILSLSIICYLFIPMKDIYYLIVSCLLLLSFFIIFWFIKECYFVRETEN